jgi:heat shock protein HslJ
MPCPPRSAAPDGTWLVEDIDGAGVLDRARLTVIFGADGQVSGQAGCNRYHGRITRLPDGCVHIGPLGVGRMMCSEALMVVEARMLHSLQSAQTLAPGPDGALVLRGDAGSSLTLRAQDRR